jgi:hypothetical protein
MLIQSSLSQDEYLNALKMDMGPFFALGSERFTGFTAGHWFYVTHHAGYEHFRKITNQKNAALGYLVETSEGCQVKFIRFKGLLCPTQFLLSCVFILFIAALFLILNHNFATDIVSIISIILAGVIVIGAPLEAFQESMTERSEIGEKCLMALLYDPIDLSGYPYYKNKL